VKNPNLGNNLSESAILVKPVKTRADGDRATALAEKGFLPAWSPDGSAIAFLRKNGATFELLSANPNGGGETMLSAGGIPPISYSVSPYNHVQTNAFAWAPNSLRIAYAAERNGVSNIWGVSVRDRSDAAITSNSDSNYTFICPVWSSDGKRIAFFAQQKNPDANGKTVSGPRMIDVETGLTTTVFASDRPMRLVGFTPDESGLIVAESSKKFSGLPPETVIKRIAIASGAETIIARLKNAYYYNIFLSNDRKFLAYAARNEEKDDIWVISTIDGEGKRLTNNNDSGLYISRLAWLHDGSAIVYGKQTRFSLLSLINDIK